MRSTDEDRLAVWLKDGTPDPPNTLSAQDILSRADRARGARTWVPAIAAASVVALIAVTIAVVAGTGRHDSVDQHVGGQSGLPSRLDAHPWHAKGIAALSLKANSLIAGSGSLYAFARADGRNVVRIDVGTGSEAAVSSSSTVGYGPASTPVLAGGYVWIQSPGSTAAAGSRLERLDPQTLRTERHTVLPAQISVLRASPDGSMLIAAAGTRIEFLSPRTGEVLSSIDSRHRVRDLSISPDGAVLYVAGGPRDDESVTALDPSSGSVESHTPFGSPLSGLEATDTGFFVTVGNGMVAETEFVRTGSSRPISVSGGSGGVYPEVAISSGVAWTGGSDELACIDPSTGHILVQVDTEHQVDVSGLTALGGRLYAVYHGITVGPKNALIEMTQPKACGLT